jgi:hypothetical protein
MRRVPHTLLLIAIASAASAETIRVEKTDPVGRKIENEFYIADLSHHVMNGKEEDSGTLRGLTYKPFGVTFFRNPPNGRMHKGISLQRAGAPGYKDIGTWTPIQAFREEQKGGFYIHHREGFFADYPEVKLEVEYRFAENAPYFLVSAAMTVEKPLIVVLVRSNEMDDGPVLHASGLARTRRRKRLVNRGPGRSRMYGIGGLVKLELGKTWASSCGEAIRSAG